MPEDLCIQGCASAPACVTAYLGNWASTNETNGYKSQTNSFSKMILRIGGIPLKTIVR